MPVIKSPKGNRITPAQIKYIEQLSIDLQFDRHRRNRHIESIILRQMHFLDDLTKQEGSQVIDKFKEWKEAQKIIEPGTENQV